MSIQISCPHCDHKYKLADTYAGKTIRCRECKEPFPVDNGDKPEADEEEEFADSIPPKSKSPASKSPPSGRKPPLSSRKKSSDSKFPLQIVLSVGGGLIGLGLIAWLLFAFVLPTFKATPVTILRELYVNGHQLVDALDSANDRDSAVAAAEKIRTLAKEVYDLATKATEIKMNRGPTDDEMRQLSELREEKQKISNGVKTAMQRIATNQELLDVILPAIREYEAAEKHFKSSVTRPGMPSL